MNLEKTIDELFRILNRVRLSPRQFAQTYSGNFNQFNGKIFKDKVKTREGVTALKELINDLGTRKPIENQLKWSFALHMAADEQAIKLGENGLLTTEGTSYHLVLPQRCQQYAVVRGRISQVYEFGGENADQILEWLLLDDGLVSRKRRTTLLDPIYKYVGIGTSFHEKYGTVTVIILAEDVLSLVAPGEEGTYIKRQALKQGENLVFQAFETKMNEQKKAVDMAGAILNMGRVPSGNRQSNGDWISALNQLAEKKQQQNQKLHV